MKKLLIGLPFITFAIILTWLYTSLKKPKAGFIAGQTTAITQLPQPGSAKSIVIDFSNCTRGSATVPFGLGSTSFAFEGISNNNCVFYYGTEIENPNWDRTLPFQCTVPTGFGEKTYTVGSFGIDIEELSDYCQKL